MSLITIVTHNDTKLDEIIKQLQQLNKKVNIIMATQTEAAAQLAAVSAQQAEATAKQTEALTELTTKIAELQAVIDSGNAGAISPELQAAIDAVVASSAATFAGAQVLADVIPNPVV